MRAVRENVGMAYDALQGGQDTESPTLFLRNACHCDVAGGCRPFRHIFCFGQSTGNCRSGSTQD